jgi:hypothetical protein
MPNRRTKFLIVPIERAFGLGPGALTEAVQLVDR